MKLALLYSRNMRNGGNCTGCIVDMDDMEVPVRQLAVFTDVSFSAMLHLYANQAKKHADSTCVFQRTDKPGFPLTLWSAVDADRLRNDTDAAVADLSEIRNVTYDMRSNKEAKK